MKITETTTVEEVWQYHVNERRRFLEPIARNFAVTVEQAKADRAEADRAITALKIAETRIDELEREVATLRHYRDVVDAALAEVGA